MSLAAANLTVLKDGVVIKTCSVDGDLVLGRSKESAIRLDDQAVSRQHAVFRWVGESLQVEKRSEFGALLVNGAECESAKLNNTDIVGIGPYVIKISMELGKTKSAASIRNPGNAPEGSEGIQGTGVLESISGENSNSPSNVLSDPLMANGSSISDESPHDPSNAETSDPDFPEGSAGKSLNAKTDNSARQDGNAGENFSVESDNPPEAVPLESAQNLPEVVEPSQMIADDAKTKFTPASTVSVKLILTAGSANVTEYIITKDEVYIGRGKDCDIVVSDKKASRRNSVIIKAGFNFLIKDLSSSNGTFVNDVKITEHSLSGDDKIRVGEAWFQFKAESTDYAKSEKDFLKVDEVQALEGIELDIPEVGFESGGNGLIPMEFQPEQQGENREPLLQREVALESFNPGDSGIPKNQDQQGPSQILGITGIDGGKKKGTLLERFKALPKRTQIIALIAVVLAGLYLMAEDDAAKKKKKIIPKKVVATEKKGESPKIGNAPASFENLTPEQKRFVESQHDLAFDYYKNKEYDKAIFEVVKIFALIPDFKDAREIERYAREGKRTLEVREEERKRKEEEAQLKDKILHLVEEARTRMERKEYEQMNEVFTEILTLDPDNASVAEWRRIIAAHKEELRQIQLQKDVIAAVNLNAWGIFEQGMKLKKSGKYHSAISTFLRVSDLGPSDQKILPRCKLEIQRCRYLINAARDPVLAEAKALEAAGDLSNAFKAYKKATLIDPPYPVGYAGMNRIRGILHERAKVIYTEAIIAESYSEFDTAKKLFKDCMDMAPADDIYHDRGARKLAHYFEKQKEPTPP